MYVELGDHFRACKRVDSCVYLSSIRRFVNPVLPFSVEKAVEKATMYTHFGMQAAGHIGRGHAPLNHLHNISSKLVLQYVSTPAFVFFRDLIARLTRPIQAKSNEPLPLHPSSD